MKKVFTVLIVILCSFALFAGGGKESATASNTVDKTTLRIGIGSEFSSVVPLMNNIAIANRDGMTIFALYDPLLWFDTATGELHPWLATEITVSDDGLVYTIKLRDDVYFHNGEKMTAEDVAFTLDQCITQTVTSKQNFPGYDHAEVVDDTTVLCIMNKPFAAAMNFFASYHFGVLDKSYYEEVGEKGYTDHPIGTGPYKFVDRVLGGSLTLEANENYWNGAPKTKNVKISILPDSTSQVLALETGEIDILFNPSIENILKLDGIPGISWDWSESYISVCGTFGAEAKPFGENFRKAIFSAIDYDAINEIINYGYTKKSNTYCAVGTTGRPDDGTFADPYGYDVEAAKKYLAESDYDGSPFSLCCITGSKEEGICKIVQGYLQTIGINAEVKALDGATLKTFQNQGEYGMIIQSAMPSLYDYNLMFQRYDKSLGARFEADPAELKEELAELALATTTEMDPDARKELFRQMEDLVNKHAYILYLYYDVNTIAYRTGIAGVEAIRGMNYRIDGWYWE